MADAALMAGKSASSPEVEGITGRYYANRQPKISSQASYDATAAARLWQASADLVELG
jgi:retinol dehydrogenase 14